MNISCSRCLKPFSITADQLGTRGKCPHCRATVILPKSSRAGLFYDSAELSPPSAWSRSMFCGLVTVLMHAASLVVLALIPWGSVPDQLPGDGTLVMIGKLPQSVLVETPDEELDMDEILNPNNDNSFDNLESEMFSPTLTGQLSQQAFEDLAFSPSGGGEKQFDFESLNLSETLAGGTNEDFTGLISRLKKEGLDIVITFDSTGSMQKEIDQVKSQINRIGSVLFSMIEKSRIGICTYRDRGDEFVVKGLPLTDNLAEVVLYLENITAAGGHDDPEAVDAGLEWATGQAFRRSARKVVLLFGDAPPHPSQSVSCQKMASDFRKRGGVVSTVTCRNFRQMPDFVAIADLGGGEAFVTSDEREIVTQLMILVFGSKHRDKVIEAFDLLENQ